MCISCRHIARFLIKGKPVIVQCSYAHAAPHSRMASRGFLSSGLHHRGGIAARIRGERVFDFPQLSVLVRQFLRKTKRPILTRSVGCQSALEFFQALAIALPLLPERVEHALEP